MMICFCKMIIVGEGRVSTDFFLIIIYLNVWKSVKKTSMIYVMNCNCNFILPKDLVLKNLIWKLNFL